MPKAEIQERVQRAAKVLKIEALLDRKPAKLSGGERQRVAIGRAIVRDPRAYLFDEPLSALDALLRLEMRSELKYLQRDLNRTLVYVTHDQVEAMSMADRMAVLRDGAVQQVATPEDIYHRPANRFVATTIGSPPMNFLPATARRQNGSVVIEHASFTRARRRRSASRSTDGAAVLRRRAPRGRARRRRRGRASPRPSSSPSRSAARPSSTCISATASSRRSRRRRIASPPTRPCGSRFDPRRLHVFDADGEALASAAGESVLRARRVPG